MTTPVGVVIVSVAVISVLVLDSVSVLACVQELLFFGAGAAHFVGLELVGVVFTATPEVGSVPIASITIGIGEAIVSVHADVFDYGFLRQCWLFDDFLFRCFKWSLASEFPF